MHETPDTDRRARLQALLHAQIQAQGGRLPFRDYMDAALYAPGLGYYASGAVSLGRGGDFELGVLWHHLARFPGGPSLG